MKNFLVFLMLMGVAAVDASARSSGLIEGTQGLLDILQGVMQKVALLGGIVILFTALLKFKEYRKNSLQTPLSRCIWLLLIGLSLVGLNYLPSEGDSPKTHHSNVRY